MLIFFLLDPKLREHFPNQSLIFFIERLNIEQPKALLSDLVKVQLPFPLIIEYVDKLADGAPLDDFALIVVLNPFDNFKNSEHIDFSY